MMTAKREVREIGVALVTVRYRDDHMATLREALAPGKVVHVRPDDAEGVAEALGEADVAVLAGDLDRRFVDAPKLRWVHCDHSGLALSAMPEVFHKGLMVTGSAGRSAPVLAQHVFFFALALTYDAAGLVEVQKHHAWRGLDGYDSRRGLWGKTMGLVGFGETGRETAALAKAMGMRVLVYRKRVEPVPDNVDHMYHADAGDSLDELLANSDVVVVCVRLSDATFHLIGRRELQLMKPSAYLVNIARGPVIDEAALVDELRKGTIAGAGLDVFEQEPLPADAAIWDAPNTVLTHHQTPEMPDLQARSLDIICENIRRYRGGEDLLNLLVPSDVYTHSPVR